MKKEAADAKRKADKILAEGDPHFDATRLQNQVRDHHRLLPDDEPATAQSDLYGPVFAVEHIH